MKGLLRRGVLLLGISMMLGLVSCMNDGGSDWVGQWQLREYQYPDGSVQQVDNIFYCFQKGSFLVHCMDGNGNYVVGYYGYYTLKDDDISITLWPDETPGYEEEHAELVNSDNYKAFFGWGDSGSRTFKVEELTNKKMRLNHEGVQYVFRKY